MNIEINSGLERYVVEQVNSGRSSTIAEVLEAAFERLIFNSEFEEEEEQAPAEAERQIAAGETITLEQLRKEFQAEGWIMSDPRE
jgi:hypothetical protein